MPQLHRPDPTPIDRALMGELGLYGDEFVDEPLAPIYPVRRVTKSVVVVINGITVVKPVTVIQSTNPNQPNTQKDPS